MGIFDRIVDGLTTLLSAIPVIGRNIFNINFKVIFILISGNI